MPQHLHTYALAPAMQIKLCPGQVDQKIVQEKEQDELREVGQDNSTPYNSASWRLAFRPKALEAITCSTGTGMSSSSSRPIPSHI